MSEELKTLKKQLLKDDRNGYDVLSAADLEKMEAYCTVYKAFLDAGKTERLSARAAIALAEKHGFVEYKRGMSLSAGDKVYSATAARVWCWPSSAAAAWRRAPRSPPLTSTLPVWT